MEGCLNGIKGRESFCCSSCTTLNQGRDKWELSLQDTSGIWHKCVRMEAPLVDGKSSLFNILGFDLVVLIWGIRVLVGSIYSRRQALSLRTRRFGIRCRFHLWIPVIPNCLKFSDEQNKTAARSVTYKLMYPSRRKGKNQFWLHVVWLMELFFTSMRCLGFLNLWKGPCLLCASNFRM